MTGRSVMLRIPASSAYLVLARTAAAALCARLDFPLDRLEDVRLAVDEAVSALFPHVRPGGEVTCRFDPYDDDSGLTIEVSATTVDGRGPGPGSFAWTVLTALVDDAVATEHEEHVTLTLRVGRDLPVDA